MDYRYLFISLKNCPQKLLRTLAGQLAFSPARGLLYMCLTVSQSVLESGWFFPLFGGKLMAQPSWELGVPENWKT